MKLLTIVGARPQFIKLAPLCKELNENRHVTHIIVHTGQHFDDNMSAVFFNGLNIPEPDINLNICGLSHGAMTGRMIERLEEVLKEQRPDKVLLFGDTNSTLAGAIAASKLKIPIAHIEAGMRSFDMHMPEEINRIVTDRLSSHLYCSSDAAIENLKKEGFEYFNCEIKKVGDIMYDAAMLFGNNVSKHSVEYILVTLHRAENIYDRQNLENIVAAINILSEQYKIILPLHPATAKMIQEYGLKLSCETIEPVGYEEMLGLVKNASLVITDSGGLQKEAYYFDRYCLTMRNQTEWTELVNAGYNILTGSGTDLIVRKANEYFNKMLQQKASFYGDGNTAELICKYLLA